VLDETGELGIVVVGVVGVPAPVTLSPDEGVSATSESASASVSASAPASGSSASTAGSSITSGLITGDWGGVRASIA
jgi:hypothetical protein